MNDEITENTTEETVIENTTETETVTEETPVTTETTPAQAEENIIDTTSNVFVKIGTQTLNVQRSLSEEERNTFARDAATLNKQIELKKTDRQNLIIQYNSSIKTIDSEIASLKTLADNKTKKSVDGQVLVASTYDVYENNTERVLVVTGGSIDTPTDIYSRESKE